jgi:hypothetical protein
MWNYLQGGKDNYQLDRTAGDAMAGAGTDMFHLARECRQLLMRAVRVVAAEYGIAQFLDIGCGLPGPQGTQNTHEVAQEVHPHARVVYVDNDKVVLAHARALLTSLTPDAGPIDYLDCDARDTDRILDEAAGTLDFSRPIAVIMFGLLGAVSFDEARAIASRTMEAVPAGSYLLFEDGVDAGPSERAAIKMRAEAGADEYELRTPEQMSEFFDDLELLEPGLVSVTQWRPNLTAVGAPPSPVAAYAAVARKP